MLTEARYTDDSGEIQPEERQSNGYYSQDAENNPKEARENNQGSDEVKDYEKTPGDAQNPSYPSPPRNETETSEDDGNLVDPPSHGDYDPSEYSNENDLDSVDEKSRCSNLNKKRKPFNECCEYPLVVVWTWQYELCQESCSDDMLERCCVLTCCLNQVGILDTLDTPNININKEALVESYMMSVSNNSVWQPVVEASVSICMERFAGESFDHECHVIPRTLYSVIDCTYIENFMGCPLWNPDNDDQCEFTSQYVQECMG